MAATIYALVLCHAGISFLRVYQCLHRIQWWPAATVDAVVRVWRLAIDADQVIDANQHPPVRHWCAVQQIDVIDRYRRQKDFGLCRLRARRGQVERMRLRGAIRYICRRRSRTAARQGLVIPTAARTVRIDRLRRPFRPRLLLGHTFWRRLNVGRDERKITSGATLPSMVGDYRGIRRAFV